MKTSASRFSNLRTEHVCFDNAKGETIAIEAVLQDTMPEGSTKGTIVALHGAPGSHNCFKYVVPHASSKGIRIIGINFPGMGTTEDHINLEHTNIERNNYVNAIIEALSIQDNIVFMGHSRGAENALQCALLCQEKCAGAVLVNSTGLRPHCSYPSKAIIRGFRKLYDTFVFLQVFWHWLFDFIYNKVMGMRVNDGKSACVAFRCLEHIEFDEHRKWINKWNSHKEGKLIIAYGGADKLIEEQVSEEFIGAFSDANHLEIISQEKEGEYEAIEWVKIQTEMGRRSLSVVFKEDGHFLQKHKALFLSEAANAILDKKNNNNTT